MPWKPVVLRRLWWAIAMLSAGIAPALAQQATPSATTGAATPNAVCFVEVSGLAYPCSPTNPLPVTMNGVTVNLGGAITLGAGSAAIGTVVVTSLPALPAGSNSIGGVTDTPVQVTPTNLSAGTVTTGGTAVTALAAGHAAKGGWISNPLTNTGTLCISETGTAGTANSVSTVCLPPGGTLTLPATGVAISANSTTSSLTFIGYGYE